MNNITVVGPSNIDSCSKILGMSATTLQKTAFETGKALAISNYGIVAVPYKGIGYYPSKGYSEFNGKYLCGILPTGIKSNVQCTEVIETENWIKQPESLVSRADIMVVIGISAGTLIEICLTKRFKSYPILVYKNFVTTIPTEIEKELNIKYIKNIKEMEDTIYSLKGA
jgi:predicted Rossmann-fold nucleotide-binding protein